MPTFFGITLILLGALIAALFVPIYLMRRKLDLRGQLLTLMATGTRRAVPLGPLLQRASEEHPAGTRRLLAALAADINAGASLSRALAEQARPLFPLRIIAAIRASEGTAELPTTLTSLSVDTTQALAARHRLSMTMFYPICLGAFLIGLQTFYLEFAGFGHETLAGDGTVMSSASVWIARLTTALMLGVMAVVGIGITYQLLGGRAEPLRRLADAVTRRAAFLDTIARLAGGERLLRSTGALVGAGLPLPEALRRSAPATGSTRLSGAAVAAAQAIEEGVEPQAAWARTALPEFAAVRAALASDAPAPTLARSLAGLADECAIRLQRHVDRWMRWVHPIAVVLFGVLLAVQFAGVFGLIHRFHAEANLW